MPGKGKNRKKLYYYEINTIYGGKIERIQYYFTTYRCKKTVNAERDVFLVCTGDKWVFLQVDSLPVENDFCQSETDKRLCNFGECYNCFFVGIPLK